MKQHSTVANSTSEQSGARPSRVSLLTYGGALALSSVQLSVIAVSLLVRVISSVNAAFPLELALAAPGIVVSIAGLLMVIRGHRRGSSLLAKRQINLMQLLIIVTCLVTSVALFGAAFFAGLLHMPGVSIWLLASVPVPIIVALISFGLLLGRTRQLIAWNAPELNVPEPLPGKFNWRLFPWQVSGLIVTGVVAAAGTAVASIILWPEVAFYAVLYLQLLVFLLLPMTLRASDLYLHQRRYALAAYSRESP